MPSTPRTKHIPLLFASSRGIGCQVRWYLSHKFEFTPCAKSSANYRRLFIMYLHCQWNNNNNIISNKNDELSDGCLTIYRDKEIQSFEHFQTSDRKRELTGSIIMTNNTKWAIPSNKSACLWLLKPWTSLIQIAHKRIHAFPTYEMNMGLPSEYLIC